MITYTIEGTPRPQGSKRHVGNGVLIESSKHVKEWRAFARMKAVEAMRGSQRIDRPHVVRIRVAFCFDRPKKHLLKGTVRVDAPVYHTSRPDSDKLLRALLDSMTEVVFEDDSQVAVLRVEKVYSRAAETLVTIERITE